MAPYRLKLQIGPRIPRISTRAEPLHEILRRTQQKVGSGPRVVFVLRAIEGPTLEQTAEALGLSVVTVKSRSFRARLQLRERLSKYFEQSREVATRFRIRVQAKLQRVE